jgi:hypothetical protein
MALWLQNNDGFTGFVLLLPVRAESSLEEERFEFYLGETEDPWTEYLSLSLLFLALLLSEGSELLRFNSGELFILVFSFDACSMIAVISG